MKKKIIPGCVILLLALTVSIGSFTFLQPCVHDDGSVGACWWAGRSLLGLGCLLAVTAVLALISAKARPGAYLCALAICAVGLLTPGTLISLCGMSTMRCRAVMQPAMTLLFAAAGFAALPGVFFCLKGEKGAR